MRLPLDPARLARVQTLLAVRLACLGHDPRNLQMPAPVEVPGGGRLLTRRVVVAQLPWVEVTLRFQAIQEDNVFTRGCCTRAAPKNLGNSDLRKRTVEARLTRATAILPYYGIQAHCRPWLLVSCTWLPLASSCRGPTGAVEVAMKRNRRRDSDHDEGKGGALFPKPKPGAPTGSSALDATPASPPRGSTRKQWAWSVSESVDP